VLGLVGPYERLVGKVDFALDPKLPENLKIVDLALAPRHVGGEVHFSPDFYLMKPVDLKWGNAEVFYEVSNRGTKNMFGNVSENSCRGRSQHRSRIW
jgi:hypothetical protein